MCVFEGEPALLLQAPSSVNANRDVLAVVLASREVFDVLEVSNGPCGKLGIVSRRLVSSLERLTYVLIAGVFSKDTLFKPDLPPFEVAFSGMLLIATRLSGISTSNSKEALRLGSSKQGKALLAAHASN